MQHFIDIEHLPLSAIQAILDKTNVYIDTQTHKLCDDPNCLTDKTVLNLFFENSTRTRTSFEIAARRLGANVVNFDVARSSLHKGETLLDTFKNLQAMQADIFVVRHRSSGSSAFLAQQADAGVAIVNAGDGSHAHPTQALLDMHTIASHKADFRALRVAIIGDIKHSRVARSQIHALNILGVSDLRVIAPQSLLPTGIENLGVRIFPNLEQGLRNVDVVIVLRLQEERMQGCFLPSAKEYFQQYGLTRQRLALAKSNAIVLHPGPINRNVEIASKLADDPQSVILQQVTHGVALRMAVLSLLDREAT